VVPAVEASVAISLVDVGKRPFPYRQEIVQQAPNLLDNVEFDKTDTRRRPTASRSWLPWSVGGEAPGLRSLGARPEWVHAMRNQVPFKRGLEQAVTEEALVEDPEKTWPCGDVWGTVAGGATRDLPTLESPRGGHRVLLHKGATINGRYAVQRVLGQGGMGVVYQVTDAANPDRPLALKILLGPVVEADQQEQFKAEFRMMSRLRHPNVARVYDFEPVAGTDDHLFTMEYVDGAGIAEAARGRSWEEVLEMLVQVCRALSYVHSRRLIHFDLKPANVLVTATGKVKVVDFGVALVRASNCPVPMRGTPLYMAPELVRGDWRIDHRVDIYSLGIMSYELLCERLPFVADSVTDLFFQHQVQTIDFRACDRVPEWLREIVRRMCAKDPADRFPTANAIIEAINRQGGLDYEIETQETRESYVFSSRFVGRTQELRRLKSFILSRTRGESGTPAALFVLGPGGVGKSRLLLEARHFAQLSHILFVESRCYEGGLAGFDPIQSILTVLTGFARAHGRRDLLETYAQDLDAVHPGILGAKAAAERPVLADDLRSRAAPAGDLDHLVARIADFMLQLSHTVPYVLCLDDFQWARKPLARLVARLVQGMEQPPEGIAPRMALVGASRDEEVEDRPAGRLLEDLQRRRTLETVQLAPLDHGQVESVIKSMLGVDTLPPPFVERVYKETDGTPFFVEEIMRVLVESGTVRVQGGRWAAGAEIGALEIPAGMAEVMARRLSFLDEGAHRVLTALAVHDSPMPMAVLRRVVDQEPSALHDALGELLRRRLAVQVGGSKLLHRVSHDRMRAFIYEQLDPDERKRWHRTIAEALEATASKTAQPTYDLARHFLAAGQEDKALRYSIEGGRKAMEEFLHDLAIDLLTQARTLLQARDPDSPLLAELEERLGDCHAIQGHDQESLAWYRRARRVEAERDQESLEVARIRSKEGLVLMTRDEWRAAAREGWEAVRMLGGREPRTALGYFVATAFAALRHLAHRLFPWTVRRATSPAEIRRFQELVAAYVRMIIAYAMVNPARAALATLRAINCADRLGPSTQACEALSAMHLLARMAFPTWASDRHGKKALQMAHNLGSIWHQADAYRALGVSASHIGKTRESVHYLEQALSRFEQCEDFFWISICHLLLFSSHAKLGHLEEAVSFLKRGREVVGRLGEDHPYQRRLDATACWLYAQMGRIAVEDAVERLLQSQPRHSAAGDMLFASAAVWMAGELLHRTGQYDRAAELFESAAFGQDRRFLYEWDMPPYLFLAQSLIERMRLQESTGHPRDRTTWRRVRRLVWFGLMITRNRQRCSRAHALICHAKVRWMLQDRSGATIAFAKARQVAREQEAVLWEADAHFEEARCWAEVGSAEAGARARKSAELALKIYERCGVTLQANSTKSLLNAL